MQFALTDSLVNEITIALENQDQIFVIDAQNNSLLDNTDNSVTADNNFFYTLPEWTSANGFKLREDFVSILNAPIAKDELQEVLHSGRGVFKNFRTIIKKYPEVEKKWFLYKNKIMGLYINDWFNELREIWGLEKLDYIPESDENLIHDDFSFREYDSEIDQNNILLYLRAYFFSEDQNIPEELKQAFFEIWKNGFTSFDSTNQTGFICHSLSDDFAGCITASPLSAAQEDIMIISTIFVPVNFRGLGIGTELLTMFLSKQKELGKKWILLPENFIPDNLLPLITGAGFKKIGSVYAALIKQEVEKS